jgi:hypothetical protein
LNQQKLGFSSIFKHVSTATMGHPSTQLEFGLQTWGLNPIEMDMKVSKIEHEQRMVGHQE